MNWYAPEALVACVSLCTGEVAVTFAPAIGWPLATSTTLPCKPPVVPVEAGSAHNTKTAQTNDEIDIFRKDNGSSPTV